MMKTLLSLSILSTLLFGVEFAANQNKAYVTKGSIEVNGYGVTQMVQSGEMTSYGENIAPSQPKKFDNIDISDIQIELEAPDDIVQEENRNKEFINTLDIPKIKFTVLGVKG